jgi:two-component system, NtrC family, sensor kinase
MTLARKIVLRNIALLAALLLLGCVSIVGLVRLRESNDTLTKEFAELRLIEQISRHTAAAREMITADTSTDPEAVRVEIRAAVAAAERFLAAQTENDEGSERHETSEDRTVEAVIAHLKGVQPGSPSDAPAAIEHLDAARGDLDRFVADADHLVGRTQRRAARAIYETLIVTAAIFLVIATAALWISVRQYRGIIVPLERLRASTRALAGGNFDRRVDERGEREFAELARDFNSMAIRLDGLYRSLEEKVAQRSRELVRSERLASVGFLAAGVAHEINNPLGIMSGYAQLTLKRLGSVGVGGDADAGLPPGGAVEEAKRTLEIIRDESFRCRAITEKLLSLSHPGTGTREHVSLVRVAAAVAAVVAAHEKYRRRQLVIDLPADESQSFVWANDGEMTQVLLNLVMNALDAVADDSGRVTVSTSRENGTVELRVRDNGCGMTPEVLDRVFEPFFTTRRGWDNGRIAAGAADEIGEQKFGGRHAGLGLSIAHAIVESHGGRLRAASDGPGAGSSFTIELVACEPRHDWQGG